MNAEGLIVGYRINRPLSDAEKREKLLPGKAEHPPYHDLAVIKFNGTYVESVDKFYELRGWPAIAMLPLPVVLLALNGILSIGRAESVAYALAVSAFGISLAIFLISRDAFRYTHFPIRFNRRNRHIYVWRTNGTVLKVPWDSVYFTLCTEGNGIMSDYVVGHVLDPDGQTVRESFALPITGDGKQAHPYLRAHFEFFRLYMDEGPQAVLDAIAPQPLNCLPPLDRQREGWFIGWQRLNLFYRAFPLARILIQPVIIAASITRWIAMLTSRIPRWPDWVEQECAVEPGDPYVRDWSTNR